MLFKNILQLKKPLYKPDCLFCLWERKARQTISKDNTIGNCIVGGRLDKNKQKYQTHVAGFKHYQSRHPSLKCWQQSK